MCRFMPGMLRQEQEILEVCVYRYVKFSKKKKLRYAGAPTPTDANNPSLTSKRASWERKEWAGVGKGSKFLFSPDRDQCSAFLALPQELENNPDSILCV